MYDCTKCGLCCLSLEFDSEYCDLDEKDRERLPKKFHKYISARCSDTAFQTEIVRLKRGPLKGVEVCKCALLRGVPMQRVHCACYEHRPRTCRVAIKPGDKYCRWFRKCVERALED